jgi:hypothetical protein
MGNGPTPHEAGAPEQPVPSGSPPQVLLPGVHLDLEVVDIQHRLT